MTTEERLRARIAELERECDWHERLMIVLMTRPHPPAGTRFDLSDTDAENRLGVAEQALRIIAIKNDPHLMRRLAGDALDEINR